MDRRVATLFFRVDTLHGSRGGSLSLSMSMLFHGLLGFTCLSPVRRVLGLLVSASSCMARYSDLCICVINTDMGRLLYYTGNSSRCTALLSIVNPCGKQLPPCVFCLHACTALAELGFMGYRRMDAVNLLRG